MAYTYEPHDMTLHLYQPDKDYVMLDANTVMHFYEYRMLFYLVLSVPDSFTFKRTGNELEYIETLDNPRWRTDIAEIILRHFRDEILAVMPEGVWHLGVRSVDDDELARRRMIGSGR